MWSSIDGSKLLRTFKAHYRSVTCMAWSDCGRYLITGGADGIVHLFPLMELVDENSRNSKRALTPFHTWSIHKFPVTCLASMNSGRMASSSEDGEILIMELFSKVVVATIKVPYGLCCLTHHDGRIYAGSMEGTIYSMDLDAYAHHQSEQHGAIASRTQRMQQDEYLQIQEKIFGKPKEGETATSRLYLSQWIGHGRPVLSIAIVIDGHECLLEVATKWDKFGYGMSNREAVSEF